MKQDSVFGQGSNRFLLFLADSLEGRRYYRTWFILVLVAALLPYLLAIPDLLVGQPYVAQNDARHYVMFLRRVSDPELYANDFIADHFLALTPWLYQAMYRPFIAAGIDPVAANLWVFMPVAALAFAAATYRFLQWSWPSPLGAAVGTVIILQMTGARDGLPHDFGYTIVLVLLVEFVSSRVLTTGASMAAATGILPVPAATTGVTMAFLMLRRRFPYITRDRRAWFLLACAGIAAIIGGVVMFADTQAAGHTFTIAEARSIPVFNPGGRRPFFGNTFFTTYICNQRAGILPMCDPWSDNSPLRGFPALQVAWAIFVPFVILAGIWFAGRSAPSGWFRRRTLPEIHPRVARVWASLVAAGIPLFVLAHVVALELHLPERFSRYTIGVAFLTVSGMAAGIGAAILVGHVVSRRRLRVPLVALLAVNGLVFLFISARSIERRIDVIRPEAPTIQDYLRRTPTNTLVAGVMPETQSVPIFGWRRIHAGLKYLVPYKQEFYAENEIRMTGFASTLYGSDPGAFARFRERNGIDYVLVEQHPEGILAAMRMWASNFPALNETLARLERGERPFFRSGLQSCGRVTEASIVLVDARCLVERANP